MRIGFFTESYFPKFDGVTYTLEAWKERLEEQGHEVYIIYPASPDYEPGENEIPVRSLPNPFYNGYRVPLPVTPRKLPEFDIVHCHGPVTLGWSGLAYSKFKGCPAVYTHHTPLEEYFEHVFSSKYILRPLRKAYAWMEGYLLRRFDTVTSSTSRINRDAEYVRLPVGLDMEFFYPREESIIDEMDVERPVVGYSGRVSYEKNIDRLVEFAEGFEGSMVIVGEGPYREKVEKNAPQNVYFRDFLYREDLPGFYSGLDVFLTSSTGDTLGLSPLEANACGTPVVAPDVPPFNETIGEENGERFDIDDLSDIADTVSKALEKTYNCRSTVEKYSLANTIDKLEDVYSNLCESDGKR